jgi:membrane-associated protease RseP (regulator of RpoE activity)
MGYLILYDDSPAIRANLKGAIVSINGFETNDWDTLGKEISKYAVGEEVTIITTEGEYKIRLEENKYNSENPWLGVGITSKSLQTVEGNKMIIPFIGESQTNYKSNYAFAVFIFNFLQWLILISFSVALINMLPMGIFDGGRFFYLTIFAITKSERKAERWFKGVTRFLLFLLLLIMVFWVIGIR